MSVSQPCLRKCLAAGRSIIIESETFPVVQVKVEDSGDRLDIQITCDNAEFGIGISDPALCGKCGEAVVSNGTFVQVTGMRRPQ